MSCSRWLDWIRRNTGTGIRTSSPAASSREWGWPEHWFWIRKSFGAIDAITRLNLQNEFMKIQESLGKTILFVTHDINEAFKLGSRVMVMNEGKLLQFAAPAEIVKNPADEFVRTLIEAARTQEQFWENVR